MATYNLRRFSNPDALKAIGRKHLSALLGPYCDFLSARGVELPAPPETGHLDYEDLVRVFMSPDSDTPDSLADALYFVHEMASAEGMDELPREAERQGLRIDGSPDPAPADVAVQVWLQDRDLLERKHAEQFLIRPRSFKYFQTGKSPVPDFKNPSAERLAAIEADLDEWFESKKRGRGARVFVYPKRDGVWFLVRHGEPYKREGSLKDGQPSSVFYRPEKHDVLVYDRALGEIRINARSKGEKDLYRRQLGQHLFGDEDFFPGDGKYTLDPLRTDGAASLVCTDIEGMEAVKLKEIRFFWGGSEGEVEIRRANDVFSAFEARQRSIYARARIIGASFQVKFSGSKAPRAVNIRPSNIAQYTRDSDSVVVEDWLMKRGFIIKE
ncbi:MAG: hypothetical protein JRC92_11770 [Deltaproteobacteria bacterium]|nr:hypothetical protein [Deltaproteobacteria bacterium]